MHLKIRPNLKVVGRNNKQNAEICTEEEIPRGPCTLPASLYFRSYPAENHPGEESQLQKLNVLLDLG